MTAHAGAAARPGLQVLDWRGAAREIVAAIFERERQRWIDQLHWDPSRALSEVEQARTTWGLPGLLAFDDGGRAIGSIFYLDRKSTRLNSSHVSESRMPSSA